MRGTAIRQAVVAQDPPLTVHVFRIRRREDVPRLADHRRISTEICHRQPAHQVDRREVGIRHGALPGELPHGNEASCSERPVRRKLQLQHAGDARAGPPD